MPFEKSPFPGMDPYLEGELWQEFHDRLANQISAQLLPLLPPRYVALLEKRYVLEDAGIDLVVVPGHRIIYPDVHVVHTVRETTMETVTGTAPKVRLVSHVPEEVPMLSIEIRDLSDRRLVTVIEIFSPANKHGKGLKEYLERRGDLLKTRTHLLELDLLRGGQRIPFQDGELPPAHYYVYLSRFTERPYTEVWPIQLRDRLPVVAVPLLPPDVDVQLDLQAAVDACFELVGYRRLLDYTQDPPPPPLDEEILTWVQRRVKNIQ
jgi:hypothetical protein